MLRQGISVYSYICAAGYSVQFSVPGENGVINNTCNDNFAVTNLEMDTNNTSLLGGFTGRFQWRVLKMGMEKASGYIDINAVTGNIEGGTLISTQNCMPVILEDGIVTCLFYDADHGYASLPNRHQCSITITPAANKRWMEDLALPGSTGAQMPFFRFVLPAPHDAGMNSMENCNAVLHTAQTEQVSEMVQQVPNLTPFKNFSPSALISVLPDIVYALTITQTASVECMLTMGARYFEFRPAKLHPLFKQTSSGLRDTHYFTHSILPGIPFDTFLDQVVHFLNDNQNEIVVIHIRWDGVAKDCARPSMPEITTYLRKACSQASKPLTWTDKTGLAQPIDVLRKSTHRIILLVNAGQYSSYSDAAYATLTPTPIINAFNAMTTQQQENADITLLQCQATATNIKEVVAYSVLASDTSNSPLAATKAICDQETLTWCRDNVLKNLQAERAVVIMNDFFDGGTADTAIGLSARRLSLDVT